MSRVDNRSSGFSTPAALGIVAGLIIIGVAGWLLFGPSNETEPEATQNQNQGQTQPTESEAEQESETEDEATGQTVTVTYTNDGFSPSTVTIQQGDTVQFVNNSDGDFQPASDDHPVHSDYPGFDANQEIGPGGTYSFTFDQVGTWGYHNHANHFDTGTVIVEE